MRPEPHPFPRSLLVLLLLASGCGGEPGSAPPSDGPPASTVRRDLDPRALAEMAVRRVAPAPGERVLLVAAPGRFDALVSALLAELDGAGVETLGVHSVTEDRPAAWGAPFTETLDELDGPRLVSALEEVDVGLMLPGADADHPVYAAYQEVLASGHGRALHFHWAGAYDLDGTERVVEPAVELVYQSAILDVDHQGMAAEQRAFEEAMRGSVVRVETPEGTDLRFRIGDRPVIHQDGDASRARAEAARTLVGREVELPAGAVRVAPVEETVEGVIAFPPTLWMGERVEGLRMRLEEGQVVAVEADSGGEAVLAALEAGGPEARRFRGFALGFNPVLEVPRTTFKWIPYYGYGAGVVRLSLGANTDIGGAVEGDWIRWDFFTEARVTVGEERWVDYGRFVPR